MARIIPVVNIGLMELYKTMLKIGGVSATNLEGDAEGNFTVTGTGAAGTFICNEPVKTLKFAAGVTSGTVYFVAGYGFDKIEGTIADGSAEIVADDATLYTATLADGAVTVAAITPIA